MVSRSTTSRSFTRPLAVAAAALASALVPARQAWAAPIKVACVGEQTTHSDQLNRSVEYPAMLQTALGSAWDAENFGDCCATVLTGYPKQAETHPFLSGGSKPSYNESLTFAPDIVVIGSWGKHDTEIATSLYSGVLDPAHFQADYETLVTTYLNLPNHPRVYVSTPVPIPKGAPTGPTTDVILPTVKAMAAKYNLSIVDLYPIFLNNPTLYKDDTHVTNVEGLQTIANAVYAELTDGGAPPAGDGGGAGDDASAGDGGTILDPDAGTVGGGGDDASPGLEVDAGTTGGPGVTPPGAAPGTTPGAGGGGSQYGSSTASGCTATPGPAAPGGAAMLALVLGAALARRRTRRQRTEDL